MITVRRLLRGEMGRRQLPVFERLLEGQAGNGFCAADGAERAEDGGEGCARPGDVWGILEGDGGLVAGE
jgi:hypothetical protein